MSYSQIIDWFRNAAKSHYLIAHDVEKRNAFFRINGNGERSAAAHSRIDYPQLCLQSIGGSYTEAGGIFDNAVIGFEIRDRVEDLTDYNAIEASKSKCKMIGEHILQLIEHESEDGSYCNVFGGFVITSVQWEFFGPEDHNEYGCRFRIPFRALAYNPYNVNLDEIFLQRTAILVDFDGIKLVDFDGKALSTPI